MRSLFSLTLPQLVAGICLSLSRAETGAEKSTHNLNKKVNVILLKASANGMKLILALVFLFASYSPLQAGTIFSPYWQTDTTVYSFIAIHNPNLSSNSSQTVTVTAFNEAGTTTIGTSSFTLAVGVTKKVFVAVSTSTLINATNLPTAGIITTTGAGSGFLQITGSVDANLLKYSGGIVTVGNAIFTMSFGP